MTKIGEIWKNLDNIVCEQCKSPAVYNIEQLRNEQVDRFDCACLRCKYHWYYFKDDLPKPVVAFGTSSILNDRDLVAFINKLFLYRKSGDR